MKNIIAAFIVFAALVSQSCNKISGDGPVVTKSYDLKGFSAIDCDIDADVFYTQDSFYKVEIQAQQNIHSIIQTPIINGELKISFEKYKNVWNHSRIVVNITAPNMTGLSVSGSGNMRAEQAFSSNTLALNVNGSGSINLSSFSGGELTTDISGSGNVTVSGGIVTDETLKVSGSGNIDLLGLTAKYATTETSGSGKISLSVTDKLEAHISGSGDVYYRGNPSVHSSISGSGKITGM